MGRMTWTWKSWLAIVGAAGLLVACGDGMDEDAGPDEMDAGPMMRMDAGGEDAGSLPDAGSDQCMGAGCEFVQVNAAIAHTCGVRGNGEIMCWGRNQEFQLGDNSTRHSDCAMPGSDPEDCSGVPVNVRYRMDPARPRIEDASYVATSGFTSTCGLRNGEMWCWSNVVVPEVAGGNPEPLRVAERLFDTVGDVQTFSLSGSHICYTVGAVGQLWCAGNNGVGQLGIGTFTEIEINPTALEYNGMMLDDVQEVDVSSNSFVCARTSDEVYCWGRNRENQLGDGASTTHQTCVIDVMTSWDCSNEPVLVGDPMGTSLGATIDLAVGRRHVCVVAGTGAMGQVECWGDNRAGAIGDTNTAGQFGLPTPVAGMDDVVQVAAGGDFSCALHTDGTVSCWGINSAGQLGDGMMSHGMQCMVGSQMEDCSPTPVSVMGIDDASYLDAGNGHACVIRGDGSVWCWGRNTSRQVGVDMRDDAYSPVMVQETAPSM